MNDTERRAAAKNFVEYWKTRGYEKGESQPFWLSLLRDIFGVAQPEQYISFENKVQLSNTSFIDGFIDETKVLIEQKSSNKDLTKPIVQSDGSRLKPIDQAKRYMLDLPVTKHPKWIVICNFQEFHIYNMETPHADPEILKLEDLEKEYQRLSFLVDTKDDQIKKEMQVSLQAGELVGEIYDILLNQYADKDDPETLKNLNMLCVRLVFCLYAEDSGLFGGHNKFHNFIKSKAEKGLDEARTALIKLFEILNQKESERDPYLAEDLLSFPYVNGKLFEGSVTIPRLNQHIIDLLLKNASEEFDWSEISPTIFGAVFESTLNPETRRSGGMHYTSIENIHKVIDPLFLDELREELDAIKSVAVERTRNGKLKDFQEKISKLTFFDPACGSGNFLTETYISLRRLENEVLRCLSDQITMFSDLAPIKVSIGQFYGIEINDFAVTVAKTALWIAESQMMKETEDILHTNLNFLPLKSYANIVEGNALRIDWETVVPKDKLNYIMGNPPFVANSARVSATASHSAGMQTIDQKEEKAMLFGKSGGVLDYVACWYKKASIFMKNTYIKAAFVSTNSICQGEQVSPLWKPLFEEGININFAHRSFKWETEAVKSATVFVVIVGFSYIKSEFCILFQGETKKYASHINAYLVEADDVFPEKRNKPLCDVSPMHRGSQPTDNGNFIYSESEYHSFIEKHPDAKNMFRKFMMGKDFIDRKPRYCLWLANVNPTQIRKHKEIMERIEGVRVCRLNSTKAATRKKAETPTLFDENQQPETDYIALPEVSSGNRKYIPIDFMTPDIVVGNKIRIVENATVYEFGILTSNVHMSWMRATCGYYGPSYQYSINIVYNNFPWPNPTDEQKAKIEQTAQAILDARALYPDCSLADLYDELTMPIELRKAHQANDKAVMQAYGFWGKLNTESECVAELMKMYQELTK